MMKKLFCIFLMSFTFCLSCKEFLEPSLEHRTMVLLAPSRNLETNNYQLIFWWETQKDALAYRLQVVSGDFNSIQKLILDTLVKPDKFTYTLDPGKYQWRVRAENGSSLSPYVTQGFTIYPSSLANQAVQLTSPTNNFYTSAPDISLEWLNLFGATQYRVQLDNQNFTDENKLVLNTTTSNLSFLKTLTSEGTYQYRVRAENATENSKWSIVRNFSYDGTAPTKVTLTAPLNNKTVAKPVQLTWSPIADAEKYELVVYKSDFSTVYSNVYPMLLITNSHTFNTGDSNEILGWKVRAIDKAGNKGSFSDLFSFTIQ
jgi:hypothetical protein